MQPRSERTGPSCKCCEFAWCALLPAAAFSVGPREKQKVSGRGWGDGRCTPSVLLQQLVYMRQLQVQVAAWGATFLPVCESSPGWFGLIFSWSPPPPPPDIYIQLELHQAISHQWKWKHSRMICLGQIWNVCSCSVLVLRFVQPLVWKSSCLRWKVGWEQ